MEMSEKKITEKQRAFLEKVLKEALEEYKRYGKLRGRWKRNWEIQVIERGLKALKNPDLNRRFASAMISKWIHQRNPLVISLKLEKAGRR